MLRGRWASGKSARIYIQAGVAHAMAVQIPVAIHDHGYDVSLDLLRYLRVPPAAFIGNRVTRASLARAASFRSFARDLDLDSDTATTTNRLTLR